MSVMVLGAGVAGLSAALELAAAGVEVDLYERADVVGGKARVAHVAGRAVDAGPTVMTMPWVFEGLFARAGVAFQEVVTLQPLEILARHAWPDGSRLDLYADLERSVEAIAALTSASEAARYRAFMQAARATYEAVEGPFIRAPRPTLWGLTRQEGPRLPQALRQLDGHRSMWRALSARFDDPRLRQLFARYATYVGSDPTRAPATLNLIAHVEALGVYTLKGGMTALTDALRDRLEALGGRVHLGAPATALLVEGGRVIGARVAGEAQYAEAVIAAQGISALAAGHLGEPARRAVKLRDPPSLSAVTWAIVAEVEGFELAHHNVFFSADYRAEFKALARGQMPLDPTIYICAQDRPGDSPKRERLLALVNAPPRGAGLPQEEIERCEEMTFEALSRAGLSLRGMTRTRWTPADFEALSPGSGGAIYGRATHGLMASLRRPTARSRLAGLYLCGGEAHPGAGVPMAALSGGMAARAWLHDRPST
ncbi:phytoene desaturase [Myxococcota bacterium]|nr:phytoene desaturase [Myxococcota bacterium]